MPPKTTTTDPATQQSGNLFLLKDCHLFIRTFQLCNNTFIQKCQKLSNLSNKLSNFPCSWKGTQVTCSPSSKIKSVSDRGSLISCSVLLLSIQYTYLVKASKHLKGYSGPPVRHHFDSDMNQVIQEPAENTVLTTKAQIETFTSLGLVIT